MRFLSLVFVGLITLTFACALDDRGDIDLLYTKLRRAMMAKSIAGVTALESLAFSGKFEGKTLTRAQSELQLKQLFSRFRTIRRYALTLDSVQIQDHRAVVTASYTYEGTFVDPSNRASHLLTLTGKVKDVLVQSALGWQISSRSEAAVKEAVDGIEQKGVR